MVLDRIHISPGMPVLDGTGYQFGQVCRLDVAVEGVVVEIERDDITIPLAALAETQEHCLALRAPGPAVRAQGRPVLTARERHNLVTATAPDPCIFLG